MQIADPQIKPYSPFVFLCLLIPILVFATPAAGIEIQKGSTTFDFNGYYKNLLSVTDTHDLYTDLGLIDKRFFLDDYNRLRLKTRLNIGETFEAMCHYEAFISNGDTILVQQRIEQMVRRLQAFGGLAPQQQQMDSMMSLVSPQATPRFMDMQEELLLSGGQRMAHNIDRLVLRLNTQYVMAEVGRMALSWGSGRLWNPTDMWAPFSPTEIDKDEKQGMDLVHVTFNIPKVGDLEGVYAPLSFEDNYDVENEDSSAGGRFRFHVGEYDISMMGGVFGPDAVAGLDFSGYLFDAGFRGEATYTFVDPEDEERDFVRAVLSVDYGWAVWGNPYLLVEGYFNGLGEPDPDDYLERLEDESVQRQILMGRAFNLGRDYLTVMSSFTPHALVTVALQPIMNLDDRSAFVSFYTKYAVTSYADLIAGTNLFFGGENTEFGGLKIEQFDIDLKNPDRYFLYLKAYF